MFFCVKASFIKKEGDFMQKVYIAEFDTCEMAFQGALIKSKLYALAQINIIEITEMLKKQI